MLARRIAPVPLSATSGDYLTWDGTAWVAGALPAFARTDIDTTFSADVGIGMAPSYPLQVASTQSTTSGETYTAYSQHTHDLAGGTAASGTAASAMFAQVLTASGATTGTWSPLSIRGGFFGVNNRLGAGQSILQALAFHAALAHSGAGTTTNMVGASIQPSFSAGLVTNYLGMRVRNNGGAGTVTNQIGVAVAALSAGTNNTHLLLGTESAPSGNWSIRNASSAANYHAGDTILGTAATPDGLLEARLASDRIALILRAHSTQTSALQEWRNSVGTRLAAVDGAGVPDFPSYTVGGVAGASGSFTTSDGKTVTVSGGLITGIV